MNPPTPRYGVGLSFHRLRRHLQMKRFTFKAVVATSFAALFALSFSPVRAQGPGGGFNVFGAGGGGMFGQMGQQLTQGRTSALDPSKTDIITLIKRPDVQADILFTSLQREQLEGFEKEVQKQQQEQRAQIAGQFSQFGSMTPEERQAKLQEFREQLPEMQKTMAGTQEEQNKKLEKMLTPKQKARLHELDLRWRGAFAMSDEKVSTEMKFDKPTLEKVKTAFEEYRKTQMEAMRGIFAGAFGNRGQNGTQGAATGKTPAAPAPGATAAPAGGPGGFQMPNFAEIQKKAEEAQKKDDKTRKAEEKKLLASLTPDQSKLWETMLGRKFTFRVYTGSNP